MSPSPVQCRWNPTPSTSTMSSTGPVGCDTASVVGVCGVAAVAGYPNVQVPAGYVYGLPVGISFFGRAFTEPKLIRLAYAYEQATRHRQPPRLLPAADLKG